MVYPYALVDPELVMTALSPGPAAIHVAIAIAATKVAANRVFMDLLLSAGSS
jgi:hypothetical protein